MQRAVPVNVGGMAAFMGAEFDEVKKIVDEVKNSYICDIANYNTKTQIVLSGEKEGITIAVDLAKEKKIKTIELPVSAPFHCSLMLKTAEELKDYFNNLNFKTPEIGIISNYSARVINGIDELKEFLYKQTFSTVKWYESILFMKNSGINDYFEIGCGNVLSGINKRIDKELKTFSMNNIADIEKVVKNLS